MLPSRPRPSGLPTGPASRLATRPRPDQPPTSYTREYSSTNYSPSSRHIRSQRTLSSLTPSHEPRSSTQTSSGFRRANSTRDYDRDDRYPRQSDGYSTSSEVSSVSSFLGRTSGDRAGYESSRTSLEEDYEPPKRDRRIEAKSMRRRGLAEPHQSFDADSKPAEGEGHSLWNQVVTVASILSVNVSNAWATNVPKFDGEETPPGQDSRLIRAMKAYHLDRARDPSDLPDWLFEDHERMPASRSRFREGSHTSGAEHENVPQPRSPPRSWGLRDVHSSTTNSASLRSESTIAPGRLGEGPGPAKTTNRLKELRDAKRNAQVASSRHGPANDRPRFEDGRHLGAVDADRRPVLRVGLPSGPAVTGLSGRKF